MTHNRSGYLFDSNIVIAILDNDHAAVNLVRQAQEEKRRIFFSKTDQGYTEVNAFSGQSKVTTRTCSADVAKQSEYNGKTPSSYSQAASRTNGLEMLNLKTRPPHFL